MTGGDACAIVMEPKAKFPGFVEFYQDGKVVGSIDAVFDFSKLQPEWHALALSFIIRHCVSLPSAHVALPEIPKHPWWRIW